MKDQKKLLSRALKMGYPHFALVGTDKLALQTIRYYRKLAKKHNCNPEFLADLKEVESYFESFTKTDAEKLKFPD